MRVGVLVRSEDAGFSETVRELERAGVHSLWFGFNDPGADPIVLASAAAELTSRVTLTVRVPRPTPVTAKALASLDALSEGRVRIVVESAEGMSLLRSMLDPESHVPMLPAPVQTKVPIWTGPTGPVDVADGVVVWSGEDPGRAEHVAAFVGDAESLPHVDEILLPTDESLWETVCKVLID